MSLPTYIGITGRKGSGKDTLAEVGIKRYGGKRWAFADLLKNQCAEIFGLSSHEMYDPVGKETPFPNGLKLEMDNFVDYMRLSTGLDILPHGQIAETPRQILQLYGTEYVRAADPNYWINQLDLVTVDDGPIWVTDMRFENEVDKVLSLNGFTIRVVYPGLVQDQNSSHASEASIDGLAVHTELVNWKRGLDDLSTDLAMLFKLYRSANWSNNNW